MPVIQPAPPPGTATDHPFTNVQWFMSGQRNTAYFAAFSPLAMTRDGFRDFVRRVLVLAPQLNWREDRANYRHVDARPFDLDAIIRFETVTSFAGYPDAVLGAEPAIFEDPELPAVRAACFVREGPEPGPRCLVLIRTSHALAEGADTALLLRGRRSLHVLEAADRRRRPLARAFAAVGGALVAPFHLVASRFQRRFRRSYRFRTLAVGRAEVKLVATRLGIRQRSLLFALVLHALYGRRPSLWRRLRPMVFGYSRLPAERQAGDDGFIRMRMRTVMAWLRQDFVAYARAIDRTLARQAAAGDGDLLFQNGTLSFHQRLSRLIPFAYDRQFFAYVPYDFVLALLPPHDRRGAFADLDFTEVYCGAHTPGFSSCVMVPQGDRITLNFFLDEDGLARLPGVEAMLAELAIPAGEALRMRPVGTQARRTVA